jgi:uncharacterized membrane protein YhaH (DUF805 family)
MTWALMPLQKYAVFSGRSRRKEFWMFVLFTFVVEIVLAIIDAIIGTYNTALGIGLLSGLFYLAILVPSIALNTRRLHDIGKSGWFQLLFIIPIVGFILWIIWMVRDSDDGVNKYGPSPKAPVGYYEGGAAPA